MKTSLATLALLLSLAASAPAQDHLVPDADAFADPDSYRLKLRDVFEEAFDEGVILRSLVLPSFTLEYLIGVKLDGEHVEAFVLEPSASVWMSERLDNCQNAIKYHEEKGEKVPPELIERLKDLKEKAVDHREIKATRRTQPLPRELAEEIKTIWKTMLLDVRHPKELNDITHGVIYHYSAEITGHGEISGNIYHPKPGSKTGDLTSVALALAEYARGKSDLDALRKKVERARISIHP